jgi:two-component system cell cycle response regulator
MIKNVFEEQILMGRLPSSPGVGRLLVELVRAREIAPAEIAKAVAIDPALTGRLIQAGRPLVPAGGGPLETAQAAVDTLGPSALLRALRDLTLVSSGGSRWCPGFDYERYWATSLARAVAAEVLVRSTGRRKPEAAYTLGLLADVGRLALASVHPAEYATLLRDPGANVNLELSRLEIERFKIDHTEVAACLLEHWGLPRVFSRAVLLFERGDESGETEEAESLDLADILRCAQSLAELHVDSGKPGTNGRPDAVRRQLRECLALSEDGAASLQADALRAVAERAVVPEASVRAAAEPEKPAAEEVPADRRAAPASRPAQGLRILAVDDDPTSLEILRRTLVQAGHTVQCAADGVEALQIALETNPQAIVADWMMPRMDGVELCRALRCIQVGREMYFLLLTGRDQEEQIVAAYDAGVDEYVTKPFNPRILLARLRAGQRVMELREQVDSERQVTTQQVRELGLLNRRLRTAALTDPLTGLPNRRCAWDRLAEEWQNATRSSTPLSVMMIDIDRFKKVNDEFGHEVGDLVLNEVAQVLRTHARQGEDVARIGGEEFLVICPNTSLIQASTGAERLRAAVESHAIRTPGFQTGATVSIGIAERTAEMPGIDALLKAADAAVYSAKSAGRNQVKLAELPASKARTA